MLFRSSVHGREFNYIKNINDEDIEGLVLLTDDIQNPYEITKKLYTNGIRNLIIIVGENLSYDNEKITILEIENYEKLNRKFDMNVLILKTPLSLFSALHFGDSSPPCKITNGAFTSAVINLPEFKPSRSKLSFVITVMMEFPSRVFITTHVCMSPISIPVTFP